MQFLRKVIMPAVTLPERTHTEISYTCDVCDHYGKPGVEAVSKCVITNTDLCSIHKCKRSCEVCLSEGGER